MSDPIQPFEVDISQFPPPIKGVYTKYLKANAPFKPAKKKNKVDISRYKSKRDLVQEAKDLIDDEIARMKEISKQLGKLTR